MLRDGKCDRCEMGNEAIAKIPYHDGLRSDPLHFLVCFTNPLLI
jgi:hypothetical protein